MKTIEINLKDVIKVEETWIKPQHSVDGYVEGLEWIRDLLKYHMSRVRFWQETPEEKRHNLGALHKYLSQFEDAQDYKRCRMCGSTLNTTGLDQKEDYVCEGCRELNPHHLSDLATAPGA